MRRRGFTFIEIMIAITVFSIGVMAVLRLVTSNLVSMDRTETRTIATFLAKEGLELVYNIRDANVQKGLPRDCLLADKIETSSDLGSLDVQDIVKACEWYFSSGIYDNNTLSLGFANTGYFFAKHLSLPASFLEAFSAFRLIQMTGAVGDQEISRYGQGSGEGTGGETSFARYILFTGVQDAGQVLPIQDILKVESHVLFVKGSLTGEIILESIIGRQ